MIANCDVHRLPTPSIQSNKSGSTTLTQQSIVSLAKTTWRSLQSGVDSPTWKRWFALLFLIAPANDRAMSIRLFAGKSTFLRRKSERELPLADRFGISYPQQWKRSFVANNFTWSNGNNARRPS